MSQMTPPETSPSLKHRWHLASEGWRDQLSGLDALPQLTILGLLTGILAGIVIVIFRLLVETPLSIGLPGHSENFEGLSSTWHFWLPFLGATAFGLVLQMVDKKHYTASVGHVIDRIHNHQARLPLGNFINQLFGGAWCLVTGQSVGREGPAVHLGAGSGSLLGQWLNLPNNSLRSLVGCGVAAAIAACFNTPLAGVIFAMEVVVMEYSITGFIPVILAAVAGTIINQLVFGFSTVFHPPQVALKSLFELPFMALAGFIVAAFAALFIRLQEASCRLSIGRSIALRFAIAGLIAGCASIFAPQIMGVGYDTIDSALAGNMGLWLLLGILAAKLLVTGVSLGVGMPGGVIGPLLFMGACVGGAVGIIAQMIMPDSASAIGFYVLLGMGAMMGAVLNAPLAAMMAILELTYNPNVIFPSMLVVVVACLTTRWAFKCEGLYQTLLAVHGKKSSLTAHEQLLSSTGARSLVDRKIKICSAQTTALQARELLAVHPHWIVLLEQKLLLHPTDLANYLSDNAAPADTLLDLLAIPARRLNMIELEDHTNLYQALINMNNAQVDAAFIKSSQSSGLGVITRESINNFYKL
ncbi:chloride channel protein [Cellvibrio zantedeschiae]|uniref:Chloride channel protein n=1 Tax=Cellvibrio zantedeschiae TaxID=1237077 RepID=A0ABQ3B5X6_9GAMM|nr:chloride channel protein [Cellvibrio zantedeschiae]GGY81152.1 chloride channel protein [Cellvibrio zantedeschiae]